MSILLLGKYLAEMRLNDQRGKCKGLKLEAVKEDNTLMEQMVMALKFTHGIARRQIVRFLGINRNVVQRRKKI